MDETVADPATAEALKPWYRQFCKRPTFNDDYLPTFNRPNVKLIDTCDNQGVERITKNAAGGERRRVRGRLHHLRHRLRGRHRLDPARRLRPGRHGGQTLSDYWADGMKTYHGFSSHGFPNCFLLGMSQNGGSVNLTSVLDDQAQHVSYIIKAGDGPRRALLAADRKKPRPSGWPRSSAWRWSPHASSQTCTPGYYNNEGHFGEPGSGGLGASAYAPGINAFNALMAKWRETGDLEGLELG